nr:hypothetical protein [Endozoicomonas sp.]
MKYELANGSLCGHAQHPELPAAGNIVESKSSEADKPWRCRFTDGCEAVFRSVKRNPLMSLCIAITTVAAGRAIAGMALNNRTTNMALNNRITNNVNSANSNSGEIEIPPHLLRSTLTKDIFINNTAAASDTSDITNNDHSGAIEGGYSSSDSITTNLPVDQAPKYRAKRQIQASGKFSNSEFSNRDRQRLEITIRATQKDVGCTAHYGPLFDLKKEFSRQEEELKKKLDYHVEANKEVLLNDINKPNGLLSIVEKLEQDVGEFMAEKSAFDPKYHTELKVISLEEYASYFSPTQNITLKELRKVEVGKVKDNAKDARIKAKSMPYCKGKIKKIKRDARDQKTKIRSMVEQASNELDCFLFRKYENDIRPRYQALKTKINDSAQLYSWPIPTQMPELAIPSECTVRPTTDWPTTVRPVSYT